MFEPNEERRANLAALMAFVATLKDGVCVSWVEVEQATGIKMNDYGRDLVRVALARSKRPKLPLPGEGFETSSAENGLEIVQRAGRAIVSALGRARETTEQVVGLHIKEMTQERRNRLTQQQAVLATLELSASLAKRPSMGSGER